MTPLSILPVVMLLLISIYFPLNQIVPPNDLMKVFDGRCNFDKNTIYYR